MEFAQSHPRFWSTLEASSQQKLLLISAKVCSLAQGGFSLLWIRAKVKFGKEKKNLSLIGNKLAKLTLMERTSNSCDLYYFSIVLNISIWRRKEKVISSNRSVWIVGTKVFLGLFRLKPKLLVAPWNHAFTKPGSTHWNVELYIQTITEYLNIPHSTCPSSEL